MSTLPLLAINPINQGSPLREAAGAVVELASARAEEREAVRHLRWWWWLTVNVTDCLTDNVGDSEHLSSLVMALFLCAGSPECTD